MLRLPQASVAVKVRITVGPAHVAGPSAIATSTLTAASQISEAVGICVGSASPHSIVTSVGALASTGIVVSSKLTV